MGLSIVQGFTKSLAMTVLSEIGDKTFFAAAILAMRHPRRLVLSGCLGALIIMTILSVLVGWAAPNLNDLEVADQENVEGEDPDDPEVNYQSGENDGEEVMVTKCLPKGVPFFAAMTFDLATQKAAYVGKKDLRYGGDIWVDSVCRSFGDRRSLVDEPDPIEIEVDGTWRPFIDNLKAL
ncbi:unnamed protein product [Fraxinus pennsylvanica]|uniref:GDT1 family protein n=1 Tax=Fraxinus pennsylvanica TaxID=56036 RepID=A0AAD1ZTA9_9LAMI|nr:unnamed protein product [Fraxinus pennsylvanica]